MTNLTPNPGWDAVPQLETTTKALGGAGGPMNSQAQALLDRTEWLNENGGTYDPGLPGAPAIIIRNALDETVDLKTKFGLTGSYGDDQTQAFINLIEYINSLASFGGAALVVGCYHIAGALPNITNGLRLKGLGFARSRIFFDKVNGLVFDLSGQQGAQVYPILEDIALTTNGTLANGFAAAQVLPWASSSAYDTGMARTFQATRVQTCSESQWASNVQSSSDPAFSNEWATHYKLGSVGSPVNLQDCHLDDCILFGSYLNMNHATVTGSIGVDASNATALRQMRPKMAALTTGTQVRGQSEGAILYGGTHVNCGYGIVYSDMVNPAHNHTVSDTHFKVHFRGVQVQDPGASIEPHNQMYFSNVYVLEKTSTDAEPKGFIGFEMLGHGSTLSNCKVWSTQNPNSITTSTKLKIGYQLGMNNNQAIGCFSEYMHYDLNIVQYQNADYNSGSVIVDDFIQQGTGVSVFYPGSLFPLGSMKGAATNGDNALTTYADSLYGYGQTSGKKWLLDNQANRWIYSNTTYRLNFNTSTSTATTDSQVTFAGGDTTNNVANKGQVTFSCDKFWTSASEMGTNADNATACGWPTRRFSNVFSMTATLSGPISLAAPSTVTAATYTQGQYDSTLVFNGAAAQTVTLRTGAAGQKLHVKNIGAFAVNSASNNVVPLNSSTAGAAILAAGPGKWATLQYDGTNWNIIAGN